MFNVARVFSVTPHRTEFKQHGDIVNVLVSACLISDNS